MAEGEGWDAVGLRGNKRKGGWRREREHGPVELFEQREWRWKAILCPPMQSRWVHQ